MGEKELLDRWADHILFRFQTNKRDSIRWVFGLLRRSPKMQEVFNELFPEFSTLEVSDADRETRCARQWPMQDCPCVCLAGRSHSW